MNRMRTTHGKWTSGVCSLALAALAFGAFATPAEAQDSRYIVVVPRLQPQGESDKKFGEKTAEELRKQIEDEKYRAFDKKELNESLKKYSEKEETLDCLTAKQFQMQEQLNLTFCGSYNEVSKDVYSVQGEFCASISTCYTVDPIQVEDEKQAASQLIASFREYTRQIELLTYCNDYIQSEQWDQAITACDRALEIKDDYIPALERKAVALQSLQRYDEALPLFERIIAQDDFNQNALYSAGYIAAQLEQKEKSHDYFNRYLEMNPGDANVRLTIAHELAQANDYTTALEMAEQGMQELPADSVHVPLVEFAGHFAKNAANEIKGTAEVAPPEAQALYNKALGYYKQVYDVQGQEANPDLIRNMVLMHREVGQLDEAIAFAESALATRQDDAGLWWVHASTLEKAERMDEALAALQKVVSIDPQFPSAYAKLTTLYVAAGNRAEAVAAATKAIDQGTLESDLAAQIIGVNGGWKLFGEKNQHSTALEWYNAARPLATGTRTQHMLNFFEGFARLQLGIAQQEPGTCQSARATLPMFERAAELLRNSSQYENSSKANLISAATRYVEIENALIKSKCR